MAYNEPNQQSMASIVIQDENDLNLINNDMNNEFNNNEDNERNKGINDNKIMKYLFVSQTKSLYKK